MINKDNIFYMLQAIFINIEFAFFDKVRPRIYRCFFKKLGKNVRISPGVHIKYPSTIQIGDNVYVGRGGMLVGSGQLNIGDNVLIGAYVKFCTTSHITNDILKPICLQGVRNKEINIGNNVWFGFDSTILLGVTIGDGSIVGANSLLVEGSSFENNSIIAGSPAVLKDKRNARE